MGDSFVFRLEEANRGSLFGGAELLAKRRVSVRADVIYGCSTGQYRNMGTTYQSLKASPRSGRCAEERGTVRVCSERSLCETTARARALRWEEAGGRKAKEDSRPTVESKKSRGRSERPWGAKRDKME